MWKLLKESRNWEKDEYQGNGSRDNKGETEVNFYLGVEMDNWNIYAEGHK